MQALISKYSSLTVKDKYLFSILILALIVRLAFMCAYPDQNFPDARAYNFIGNEIMSGSIIKNNTYMPLYPIWVKLTGGGIYHIIMDIIISVASIALIFFLSLAVFKNTLSALLSAFIACFYPHFIFYSVSGLTEIFYTFLLLLSFLSFYGKKYVIAIIILTLALLVKPSLDYLNPILIILFVSFVHKSDFKKTFKYLTIYGVMYVTLLSPWWLHQYEKYGEFVKFTLADGIVLYSGNNPLNTTGGGVGRIKSDSDMDLNQFNQIDNPVRRNEAMKEAAFSYILNNPDQFIKMAGVKFMRFWRLWPFAENYQQWYVVMASLMSYGTVLFLAIGFVFRNSKQYFRKVVPIFSLVIYLTLIHMVTIGSIRYRFPIEPFLIIFASYFLTDIFRNKLWLIKLKKYLESSN
jgi:4-amino-4-deoxy-L-arabinose transferase-like glycosyltransferase